MNIVTLVEIASLFILGFYVSSQPRGQRTVLLADGVWIGISAWLGEASCIALYGFYGYAPGWTLQLLRVPLMVACIWPAVVLSSEQVSRALWGQASAVGIALMVFFDASLIETVAVKAGLWTWSEGAVFAVPWIGLVGWAAFSGAASQARQKQWPWYLRLLAPILVTHSVLLGSWWGLLRWVLRGPPPEAVLVAASVLVGGGLGCWLWPRRFSIPLQVLAPRAVAAGLFFFLLFAACPWNPWLAAFIVPFSVPWLVVTRWTAWRASDAVP